MAKHKRKISSAQRDKFAVETARILKKKGAISKQAKLHGGRFVSRGVLKKVQELQHVAKPSYTALKVSKAVARQAKNEGYQVVQGNRVIVPKDHDFIKRVKRGELAGIKPVKGGFMSEVKLAFDPSNYNELLEYLDKDDLDAQKLPGERFAFQVGGTEGSPMGMSYRSFGSSEEIRHYLRHYKPDVFLQGLKFFRLHPEDEHMFILPRGKRPFKRNKGGGQDARGNPRGRKTYSEYMRRMEINSPGKAAKIRAEQAEKSRKRHQAKKNDPVYRENARLRALKSWHKRHPKKG